MIKKKTTTQSVVLYHPTSVQDDLFQYLRPRQRKKVRAILRVLNKKAQSDLVVQLLDYLETGQPFPPEDDTLSIIYLHMIKTEIIRPLNIK